MTPPAEPLPSATGPQDGEAHPGKTPSPARYRLSRRRRMWLSRRVWRRRLVFWGAAIATGVASAGFAVAATRAEAWFGLGLRVSPWLALALTPLGFAASAALCRFVFPGAQGSGIPQAIAARHLTDPAQRLGLLSLRLTVGKILLTLVGLACGASIGREGPTVQVGASIMLNAARLGGVGRERGLILAGSAAGVAAAFNTPLAGVVFAIEEMGKSFEQRTSGLVLSTVILAGIAAQALNGNHSYFGRTVAGIDDAALDGWAAVALLGVAGGVMGAAFSRCLLHGIPLVGRFVQRQPLGRSLLVAGLCGLVVALAGLASDGAIYGTGYEPARAALGGHILPWFFAPLKFVATLASSISGVPGGFFAPSLAIGTGLGGVLAPLMPALAPGALAALGMAGYFAGVVQAPITTFVIIVEMTDDHTMVVPLMATSLVGYAVSRALCPPLYHTLAEAFWRPLLRRRGAEAGEAARAGAAEAAAEAAAG